MFAVVCSTVSVPTPYATTMHQYSAELCIRCEANLANHLVHPVCTLRYQHTILENIRNLPRFPNAPSGGTNLQLAELTGAALYALIRHALSKPSPPLEPTAVGSAQPVDGTSHAARTHSSSAEGAICAFATQIGSELQTLAHERGHGNVGYGALCTAMAAEACVAAASQALAASVGVPHRNPFHEILAGRTGHGD